MAKALKQKLKIAISGKSGCGNTTVSRIVAEKTGLAFINFTFRSLAVENRLSLEDILEKAMREDRWDREVDSRQVEMARASEAGCVLGSRLAIWKLPEADLKVYLKADTATRARRIVQREGKDFAEVEAFTKERDRQDRERYLRLYGIDNDKFDFADLIIDTTAHKPEKIARLIISAASKKSV